MHDAKNGENSELSRAQLLTERHFIHIQHFININSTLWVILVNITFTLWVSIGLAVGFHHSGFDRVVRRVAWFPGGSCGRVPSRVLFPSRTRRLASAVKPAAYSREKQCTSTALRSVHMCLIRLLCLLDCTRVLRRSSGSVLTPSTGQFSACWARVDYVAH